MRDAYSVIVDRIVQRMRSLPAEESERLAFDVTSYVNNRLRNLPLEQTDAFVLSIFKDIEINPHCVGCAWSAYDLAHGSGIAVTDDQTELLCTVPAYVRLTPEFRAMAEKGGIWAGSLFDAVCRIFNSATSSLMIMVPYWSTSSVESFLRHISRWPLHGLDVTIYTQHKDALAHQGMLTGLLVFTDALKRRGAKCHVLHPLPTSDTTPLVHAKLAVSDQRLAYLGSANFTTGGTDLNYEMGVILQGHQAERLERFLIGLHRFFVVMELDGEQA